MIVVSDTSPLCNLVLVEYLWLLRQIYGIVIIPNVVADELKAASNVEIQNICNLEWIQTRSLARKEQSNLGKKVDRTFSNFT